MSKHQKNRPNDSKKAKSPQRSSRPAAKTPTTGDTLSLKGPPWLYGHHAVTAALANPARVCHRLIATKDAASAHQDSLKAAIKATERKRPQLEIVDRRDLDAAFQGASHQGIAVQIDPLPRQTLDTLDLGDREESLLIVLDQATDPQNIGAIMRSAAAFNADGLIVQDRNTPDVTPAMAKTACGALERLPFLRVTNLSRSLDELKEDGFWIVGLDGYADQMLDAVDLKGKIVLVMGAEGSGLRRLTKEKCDFLAKIPISQAVESLNLSNATAISLYEIQRQRSAK